MLDRKIPENLFKRAPLEELKERLEHPEILLLAGPRQVGKTSLLFLLVHELLQRGVSSSQIFYFDLENIAQTEELNAIKDFEKFVKLLASQGADISQKVWVFIDEIQYLDHPSSFLKYIYDHYKGVVKFIVSGSSTLEIKKKFTDRLTGRIESCIIHTLDFADFLHFSGRTDLATKRGGVHLRTILEGNDDTLEVEENLGKEFQEQFDDFCIYGSYPATILSGGGERAEEILRNIHSLYVRKDIKDMADIEDTRGFNNLVGLLAHQIGNLVNETELANSSDLSRYIIKKHLALLVNTFVCHFLTPFYTNGRTEYTKMPKVYFFDNGLRNAIINSFAPIKARSDAGALAENAIINEIIRRQNASEDIHFWRSEHKTEVDVVIEGPGDNRIPIEIKYQHFTDMSVPSGLRSFIKRYHPKKAAVVTKDFYAHAVVEGVDVVWIPAWMV
jgi:uncharacterized protein